AFFSSARTLGAVSNKRITANGIPTTRMSRMIVTSAQHKLVRPVKRFGTQEVLAMPTTPPANDLKAVEQLAQAYRTMTQELSKVIVGQQDVVEQVLTAMFCQGHVLLVGVPGLAKTLLVKTISDVLHLAFKRVQFTPDLMP